jgi:hypothetical protein
MKKRGNSKRDIPGTIVPMKVKGREGHYEKILYTIIIAFAVVCFWRGCWGLMDLYLFPDNHFLSFSVSAFVGILILALTKNLIKHLV